MFRSRTKSATRVLARAGAAALVAAAPLLGSCEPGGSAGPVRGTPESGARRAVLDPARVDFYIHAHEDDWQLFMGASAHASARTAGKLVFVYATAGDGGRDATYWQAREAASKASVDAITEPGTWSPCTAQTIGGHPIERCAKGAVVSYYLRLPDGGYGYGTGFGTLDRLRDLGSEVSAVDRSTTYATWTDFHGTLRGIIEFETAQSSATVVSVHAPDYDVANNPADHADHLATGDAVNAATAGRAWELVWHVDYESSNLPANLTSEQQAIERNEFLAYDAVMSALVNETKADEPVYGWWSARNCFRS